MIGPLSKRYEYHRPNQPIGQKRDAKVETGKDNLVTNRLRKVPNSAGSDACLANPAKVGPNRQAATGVRTEPDSERAQADLSD
jgi:hypothetical protein